MKTRVLLSLALAMALGLGAHGAEPTSPEGFVKLNVTVNGQTIRATLFDNETTRDFVSLLPLTS